METLILRELAPVMWGQMCARTDAVYLPQSHHRACFQMLRTSLMVCVELLLFPPCVLALCLLSHCASPWISHISDLAPVALLHCSFFSQSLQASYHSPVVLGGVQDQGFTGTRRVIYHRAKYPALHAGFRTAVASSTSSSGHSAFAEDPSLC